MLWDLKHIYQYVLSAPTADVYMNTASSVTIRRAECLLWPSMMGSTVHFGSLTVLQHSSTLPIRTTNRSSVYNHSRIYSTIPTICWSCYKPKVINSPIRHNIYRSKYNAFSTTLSRIRWYTMMILRLSRWLHDRYMKYHFVNRINNLICTPFHHRRKNYIQPTNTISHTHTSNSIDCAQNLPPAVPLLVPHCTYYLFSLCICYLNSTTHNSAQIL